MADAIEFIKHLLGPMTLFGRTITICCSLLFVLLVTFLVSVLVISLIEIVRWPA